MADLERSLAFYRDVLGFEITQRYGTQAVFLSAGGYHHHIGLNTWESAGGQPPPPGTEDEVTGCFFAVDMVGANLESKRQRPQRGCDAPAPGTFVDCAGRFLYLPLALLVYCLLTQLVKVAHIRRFENWL